MCTTVLEKLVVTQSVLKNSLHFMESWVGHISKNAAGHKIQQLSHQGITGPLVLTAGRPGTGADDHKRFNIVLYRTA